MSRAINDVIEDIRRDSRIIANTERLLADALVVLCARDGENHRTVKYDDWDVCAYANDVLRIAYGLRKENEELKAKLKEGKIPWYKRLFHC